MSCIKGLHLTYSELTICIVAQDRTKRKWNFPTAGLLLIDPNSIIVSVQTTEITLTYHAPYILSIRYFISVNIHCATFS